MCLWYMLVNLQDVSTFVLHTWYPPGGHPDGIFIFLNCVNLFIPRALSLSVMVLMFIRLHLALATQSCPQLQVNTRELNACVLVLEFNSWLEM